jgi:myo-inositol-1(or 4)-monophosphatase
VQAQSLLRLLPEVIEIARTAAEFIRSESFRFKAASVEQKGLNDLVSYVDKTSEKMLVEALRKKLPGCGFITEENTAEGKQEYNWIIDPLDGTTNFVQSVPCYAVSIALERNNEIILGVVYEVVREECFYATAGNGAFMNGTRIHVSEKDKLGDCLIATGFPVNDFSKVGNTLKAVEFFMRNTRGVRRIGAASADLCYLACGRFDGFFEYNLKAWDVAAGALIVQEAGGKVTDFRLGNNWLFGKEMCASNKNIFALFSEAVKNAFSNL